MEDYEKEIVNDKLTQADLIKLMLHNAQHMATRDEVKADINNLDSTLNAKIDKVEASLTAKIDKVEASLNTKIDKVEASLTAKIDNVETSLTAKIDKIESPFVASFVAANIPSAKTSFEIVLLVLIKLFKKEFSFTVFPPIISESSELLSLFNQLLIEKYL